MVTWTCLALLIFGFSIQSCSADCVWYDNCYHDRHSKTDKPCPYFGPARKLDNVKASNFLLRHCPHTFERGSDGEISTCCSPHQVEKLKTIFDGLASLTSCPSCYSNIAHLFCGLMCSPDQSSFMADVQIDQPSESVEVELPGDPILDAIFRKRHPDVATRPHETCSSHSFISAVKTVRIDPAIVNKIVTSCANVRVANNLPDFQALTPWTVDRLLQYAGNPKRNPKVPVEFRFKAASSEDSEALHFTTYGCNESEPRFNRPCACVDCPTSCVLPVAEAEASSLKKGYFTTDSLIAIIISATGVATVVVVGCIIYRIYRDKTHYSMKRAFPIENIIVSDLKLDEQPCFDDPVLLDHKKLMPNIDITFTGPGGDNRTSTPTKNGQRPTMPAEWQPLDSSPDGDEQANADAPESYDNNNQ